MTGKRDGWKVASCISMRGVPNVSIELTLGRFSTVVDKIVRRQRFVDAPRRRAYKKGFPESRGTLSTKFAFFDFTP
jgi:hypothetical protein